MVWYKTSSLHRNTAVYLRLGILFELVGLPALLHARFNISSVQNLDFDNIQDWSGRHVPRSLENPTPLTSTASCIRTFIGNSIGHGSAR